MLKNNNVFGDHETEYIFAHRQTLTKLDGLCFHVASRSKQFGLFRSTAPKSAEDGAKWIALFSASYPTHEDVHCLDEIERVESNQGRKIEYVASRLKHNAQMSYWPE